MARTLDNNNNNDKMTYCYFFFNNVGKLIKMGKKISANAWLDQFAIVLIQFQF